MKQTVRKQQFLVHIFYFIVIVAALTVILFVNHTTESSLQEGYGSYTDDFNHGWSQITSEGETPLADFPLTLTDASGQDLIITKELPEFTADLFLCFKNAHQPVQAFIDDVRIFQYAPADDSPLGKLIGNYYCFIKIPKEYSKKELTISFTCATNFNSYSLPFMELGMESALLLGLVLEGRAVLLFVILIIFLSIILLAGFIIQYIKQVEYNYFIFFHLSLFFLLSALWVFTDSVFAQFLIPNMTTVCIISFYSFMLIPLPFLSLAILLYDNRKQGTRLLQYAFLLNFGLQNALFLTGSMSIMSMIPITHLLITVSIIWIIYCSIKEAIYKKSFYAKCMLGALGSLLLFSMLALIEFYTSPLSDISRFYRYGLGLFGAFLVLLAFRMLTDYVEANIQTKIYKNLAYMDVMTQMHNRTSFESRMMWVQSRQHKHSRITIFLMDVNHLKTVNDTYGHKAGDDLICAAAQCIQSVFADLGSCYRIGGDEFVVLILDKEVDGDNICQELKQKTEDCQTISQMPVSIACGWATKEIKADSSILINCLLKSADKNMYEDKRSFERTPDSD